MSVEGYITEMEQQVSNQTLLLRLAHSLVNTRFVNKHAPTLQ